MRDQLGIQSPRTGLDCRLDHVRISLLCFVACMNQDYATTKAECESMRMYWESQLNNRRKKFGSLNDHEIRPVGTWSVIYLVDLCLCFVGPRCHS